MRESETDPVRRRLDNGVFCMLPWTSLHVATGGDALPCCVAEADYPLGSTRSHGLEEIWNGPPMRELRLRMLEGRRSRSCEKCYEQEASGFASLRNVANADFRHHSATVAKTRDDGSLPQMNIALLDVRFSNVCNFTCRTCGPSFSTAWYRYTKEGGSRKGVIRPKESPGALLDELRPLLGKVERIYFAGGEPALIQEHYELLEALLAMGRTNVQLSYSTNFSLLRFKHWDLLEMWRCFPQVSVGASLDGSGARAEYLRKGQRWDQVIENRRRQLEECPHVSFKVSSTLSILNCLHMPDFHEEWATLGLIRPWEVFINILQIPSHFRVTTLPGALKDKVRARYAGHMDYLAGNRGCEQVIKAYAAAIGFMEQRDTMSTLPELRRVIQEQDSARDESFADTFPELRALLDDTWAPPRT